MAVTYLAEPSCQESFDCIVGDIGLWQSFDGFFLVLSVIEKISLHGGATYYVHTFIVRIIYSLAWSLNGDVHETVTVKQFFADPRDLVSYMLVGKRNQIPPP